MAQELDKLIQAAKFRDFTAREREEQRRSFAYGNTRIENSRITRETVDKAAETLNVERARSGGR
jgi:hypothetical protein